MIEWIERHRGEQGDAENFSANAATHGPHVQRIRFAFVCFVSFTLSILSLSRHLTTNALVAHLFCVSLAPVSATAAAAFIPYFMG